MHSFTDASMISRLRKKWTEEETEAVNAIFAGTLLFSTISPIISFIPDYQKRHFHSKYKKQMVFFFKISITIFDSPGKLDLLIIEIDPSNETNDVNIGN